jgi:hypothetical protein
MVQINSKILLRGYESGREGGEGLFLEEWFSIKSPFSGVGKQSEPTYSDSPNS